MPLKKVSSKSGAVQYTVTYFERHKALSDELWSEFSRAARPFVGNKEWTGR